MQQLLRLFGDEQSIKPGQKWRLAIDTAPEHCQIILVFGAIMPLRLRRYRASTSVLSHWANVWCQC
jgi:hypothetical protein